jgi:hypothetical protein
VPAFFLLNNKRGFIADLEKEHGVQVLILPDGRLRPDEYEFEMEGVRDTKRLADPAVAPSEPPKAQEVRTPAPKAQTSGGRTTRNKTSEQGPPSREASEA